MFSTGLFILEVQKRPCLWKVKDVSRSDRFAKLKAWQEIANVFNNCNDSYSYKNTTVAALQRKWKHLRDYFIREKKRTSKASENGTNSTGRKRNSPLLEMLQFLNSNQETDIVAVTIERNEADENFFPESNEEEDRSMSENEASNSRPQKVLRIEAEQSNPLADSEESAEELFLSSLLPFIKNMSARERCRLRAQLMKPVRSPQELPSVDDEERKNTEARKRRKHETEELETNKQTKSVEVTNKRDEYSIYGEYVANKLRNIPNSHARHTAEFHINGILYKAEMGEFDSVAKDITRSGSSKETDARVIDTLVYDEEDSNDVIKSEILD